MTSRAFITLLLAAFLASAAGCVYYNTFYHARAAAREAELMREARPPGTPPGPGERELLERVAEKCGLVLQLHPDSDWADDALLLLGTTHYYQQRYETAERRLTEFISLHPESELRPEAEYMLARVLLSRGNPVSAETTLETLVEMEPPHELSDDALALIGEARHQREKYDEASEAYERALERFPGSDRRVEIRFLAAENFEEAGDLDAAAREFALVTTESGSRAYAFEARMRLAQVDLERGRPDEALDVLGELEPRVESRDDRDRVLLMKGRALVEAGRVDEAVTTYEGISADHKRSEASGEAQYRIGIIRRDHLEDLDGAVESFRSARDEAPRTDVAAKATAASEDVTELIGLLGVIERATQAPASGDSSVAVADSVAAPRDSVAASADSVAASLESVSIDSTVVDTAAVVSSLQESLEVHDASEAIGDSASTAGAEVDSVELVDVTVDSSSSVGTPGAEGVEVQAADVEGAAAGADTTGAEEEEEDEVAVARFRSAEIYLFSFEDPDRAAVHYTAVIEQHPDSGLAPKAALALAWMAESHGGDVDRAVELYRSVVDAYPGTDFADAALEGIARLGGSSEVRETQPGPEAETYAGPEAESLAAPDSEAEPEREPDPEPEAEPEAEPEP